MLFDEQLVGEARERRATRMDSRERLVDGTSAVLFLCVAIVIVIALPSNRDFDLPLTVALIVGYALIARVRFEFADAYVSAEELAWVPFLLLLPAPYVPLFVAAAVVIATLPEYVSGTWHRGRWITCISDSWFSIGPVLVVGLLAPGAPSLSLEGFYALAFLAHRAGDFTWTLVRDRLLNPMPFAELVRTYFETVRVDAVFWLTGLIIALVAFREPAVLLTIGPLVWLLANFSRDRRERYSATLELNRAYRGTVMLLSDVVEFDDTYTADHSRSVVELVLAVADELEVKESKRQELEFAALLHDVGKISIPKAILNKPGKLDSDEFELIKTHTIEGQFMLDRVGGLLARVGEVVRSCHERWDGEGYPDGLVGDEIPFGARIVFTCDAYNAMTTDRPYRGAMAPEKALAELEANSGTQFDPRVVEALAAIVQKGNMPDSNVDEVRALVAGAQLQEQLGLAS